MIIPRSKAAGVSGVLIVVVILILCLGYMWYLWGDSQPPASEQIAEKPYLLCERSASSGIMPEGCGHWSKLVAVAEKVRAETLIKEERGREAQEKCESSRIKFKKNAKDCANPDFAKRWNQLVFTDPEVLKEQERKLEKEREARERCERSRRKYGKRLRDCSSPDFAEKWNTHISRVEYVRAQ